MVVLLRKPASRRGWNATLSLYAMMSSGTTYVLSAVVPARVLSNVLDVQLQVVQMALKAVPVDRIHFSDTMVRDIKQIIVAKYGCKVVMEAIHALSPTDVNLIVDMMANNSTEIINDGHAVSSSPLVTLISRTKTEFNVQNYVWQYIVRLGTPEQRRILISRLMGNFASYSMSHISSWCCQKALEHADVDQRRGLILELFDLDHRQLGHLAEHKNGSEFPQLCECWECA